MLTLKVNANAIIDTLMAEVEEIHARYANVPKEIFIGEDSPYKRFIENQWKAERVFVAASDMLNVSETALYATVLTARRWYNRTQWEKSLPDDDAERLLNCMIRQNTRGYKWTDKREDGNEYLLTMNKVISEWAAKSRKKNNEVA